MQNVESLPKHEATTKPTRDILIAVTVVVVSTLATKALDWLGDSNFPWWAYIIGACLGLTILTLVLPGWRTAIWGNVAKWRPLTTTTHLQELESKVRTEVRNELDAQRQQPIVRAQWFIARAENEQLIWRLRNVADGSIARAVSVDVPHTDFMVGSALDWERIDGGQTETFSGAPTEAGRGYGVNFTICWTDANSQRQNQSFNWDSPGFY